MAFTILRLDMRAPDFSPAGTSALYEAALDMAAYVDEAGFDTVTLSEHHGEQDGYLCAPIPLAGLILGRTRRVRVGVVALLVPLYEPIKLAEDMALLDIASSGRFAITAGIGYRESEYEMMGRDWKTRGQQMDACLETILTLWPGEPCHIDGRAAQLTPRPLTQPKPPIFVGGVGRNAARRAARLGLPFQPAVNTPEVLALYTSECAKRGVETPLVLPPGPGEMIWVSEDPDRTWQEIGRYLLHEAMTYASWQPENQKTAVRSYAGSVEELRAEGKYLVLTPEQCLERAKTHGAFATFIHYPLCGGTPPELGWKSLRLFVEEVLPAIRALEGGALEGGALEGGELESST